MALLSFRSLWVWYKCVKEWEYFSMWGWKEVRRLSHWVFLYMDQLWQKIHVPGFKAAPGCVTHLCPSQAWGQWAGSIKPLCWVLPHEQILEGWILIVCLTTTTLLNNIRRGKQISAAYFSPGPPEDVCEPRETPQYTCTRRASCSLKISPNQNSFPTHKQRTPTLVTHSALPIHWRHNDCPIFLKSHWKWFHSYKWLINM